MRFYDIERVSYLSMKHESYDVFCSAPNVEKRSQSFFVNGVRACDINKVFLIDFPNFHKSEYEGKLNEFYDSIDREYERIVIESDETASFIRNAVNNDNKIAIDLTGFSIPNIYQIIHALYKVIRKGLVDFYYTEPKLYIYSNTGYYDEYHPKSKQRQCSPIKGYINSGENQEEILVIFLGFDGGLAQQVYLVIAEESIDVIDTFAINGLPSYAAKLKDVSILNNHDLITRIGINNLRFASANNPFSAYNTLVDLSRQYKNTLLNVCTIGSKPMAIGASLFALDNPQRVKITYPFYSKTEFDVDEEPGITWRYSILQRSDE